jgi:hypothetical protein
LTLLRVAPTACPHKAGFKVLCSDKIAGGVTVVLAEWAGTGMDSKSGIPVIPLQSPIDLNVFYTITIGNRKFSIDTG